MYTDEYLLKMKKRMEEDMRQREKNANLEEEIEQSIFDGKIQIFSKDVTFVRREISEFGISILIPEDFAEMEENMCKLMYPNENGPKHVFTNEEGYMNVSFKQSTSIIKQEQLKDFVQFSKKIMEAAGMKVKVVKTGELGTEENRIGTMEYISDAIDGVAYTYMGFVTLEKGVLMVCVVYKNSKKKRLNPVAREILESILIIEEKEA